VFEIWSSMKNFTLFGLTIPPAAYIPVLYFLWVAVFQLLKKLFYRKIRKLAAKTTTKLDDIILYALDFPLVLLICTSGVFVLENIFKFGGSDRLLGWVNAVFIGITIIAAFIFFDRLLSAWIHTYSEKMGDMKGSLGVLRVVVRVIVLGIGILMILGELGISVTPIIASLGVGSLAVALALQPTLENFFSGLQIIADKPIVVGQFIKLDTGEEGYVEKIGWRSTWVRMLPNNMVVIPNKILVNTRVLNYYYPSKELAVLVELGVDYRSDLEKVERVTIEVAEEIMQNVEGGIKSFKPFIRYNKFNDFSIDFTVIMRGKEFVDTHLIKHEFIKRLHKRYNQEGIVIPFPIRTLEWAESSKPVRVSQ